MSAATTRLIGILGGTFDPVHYGHLRPAAAVLQQADLDELRLVPCREPAHRPPPLANAEQRVALLRLAVQEFPEFLIDDRELRRPGPSYTVDTLSALQQELPQAHWCLILGMDAFLGFKQWHRWQHILELAHLLVMARPGYQSSATRSTATELLAHHGLTAAAELRQQPAGGILLLPTPEIPISSTEIRAALHNRQPVQDLMPAAVADWLQQQPIYQAKTDAAVSIG